MAIETPLEYFLGKDQQFQFTIYRSKAKSQIRDITGYALNFMVKREKSDLDAAALFSASASITGTYNADPASNTQLAVVAIADTDLPVTTTAGQTHWELARTDDGSETVLAYGRLNLKKPVHA